MGTLKSMFVFNIYVYLYLCLFGLVDLTLVEIGEFIHRYIENYLYIRYVLVYGKHAALDCFNLIFHIPFVHH